MPKEEQEGRPPFSATAVPSPHTKSPELFYLPRMSSAQLADASLVTSCGRQLPVHSQILALASPVLETAFAGQAEGGAPSNGPTVLSTPFSQFSIEIIALWLRFAYSPADLRSASLAQLPPAHLPALLQLAHMLEATAVVNKVLSYCVKESMSGFGMEALAQVVDVAESCGLDDRRSQLLGALVQRLVQKGRCKESEAALAALSKAAVTELLWSTVQPASQHKRSSSFSWRVANWESRRAAIQSKAFDAGGARWQLKLYPIDEDEEFMGLFLNCLRAPKNSPSHTRVRAKYTLTLRSVEEGVQLQKGGTDAFVPGRMGWGWSQFCELVMIDDYFVGMDDVVRLSAEVEVLNLLP